MYSPKKTQCHYSWLSLKVSIFSARSGSYFEAFDLFISFEFMYLSFVSSFFCFCVYMYDLGFSYHSGLLFLWSSFFHCVLRPKIWNKPRLTTEKFVLRVQKNNNKKFLWPSF